MKAIIRLAFVICMAGNHLATAQSLFGTILGTVTDSSQAVVAGARVTIRSDATSAERVLTTDSLGNYEAPTLPVGSYQVTCESTGFKREVVKGIVLQVDERQRVDVKLEVGQVVQTVEISAAARLIETDTATQSTVIDNRNIVELPLNGRSFLDLAPLSPGVVAPVTGSTYFSVAGDRQLGTSYMMDGATNSNTNANTALVTPSIDLIQEFTVLRNTFSAEYGHGASQINVVTKSGANQWHLTLFEFLRNDKIQARNFFDPSQKPELRKNQFGGTISGPMTLPKLYNGRDRTFWLFNYEGLRSRNPSTLRAAIPTQTQLSGDLSGTAAAVTDPLTKIPFPNKQIPVTRFDPTSVKYMQFIPVTQAPLGSQGAGLNYLVSGSAISNFDQITTRIDHSFNSTNNIFVRYTMNDAVSGALTISPYSGTSNHSRQQSAVLAYNLVIRPNLINEFRMGFARHNAHIPPNSGDTSGPKLAETLGLHNLLSLSIPSANALPSVGMSGFTNVGGGALITQRVNTFSYVDNLSWVRRKHSLKFGVDIRRLLHDTRNIGSTEGTFSFTTAFTKVALGDFLLGIPQTASGVAPPGPDGVNLANLWQGFVQDDWKATSRLTLSFGMRYEYLSPWVNNRNHISLFDPSFPGGRVIYPAESDYFVPGKGFIPTDHPLASRGLYAPDYKDFGPRFGFAWRPFNDNRSSVRGSYGLFTANSNETNNIFSIANPPHLVVQSITNDITSSTPMPWSQMFPTPNAGVLSIGTTLINSVAPKMPSGYVQQWSFNLQHEIRGMAVELGYIGAKSTRLDKRIYLNQAVLDQPGKTTTIASRQPYPAFAVGMIQSSRLGMSNYNAFISRVQRRFSNGFSFMGAYTRSKTLDNCSYSGNIAGVAQAQNTYDDRSEKALAYFDTPNRFVANYIYELPFGPGRRFVSARGVTGSVVGGWKVSGITQYQTGNPWSILANGDRANVGTAQQRADLVGNPFPPGFIRGGTDLAAFNVAAFANPKTGTFGNSGRDIIRDASISNTDLAIARSFQIKERRRLDFRTEFFNAWNHTQFTAFAYTIGGTDFGHWSTARSPRILQFGLKLNY